MTRQARLIAGLLGAVLVAVTLQGVLAGWLNAVAYGDGLINAHVPLGQQLATYNGERKVLALNDAGAIPFLAGLDWFVVDTFGLNDRVIARREYEDYADYVFAQQPSVLVLMSSDPGDFRSISANENALFEGARQRGMMHVATFEFKPEYLLWVMADPAVAALFE